MKRVLFLSIGLIALSGNAAFARDRAAAGVSDPILIGICTDDFTRCEVTISDRMMSIPAATIFEEGPQGVSAEATSSIRRNKAEPTVASKEQQLPSNRRSDF